MRIKRLFTSERSVVQDLFDLTYGFGDLLGLLLRIPVRFRMQADDVSERILVKAGLAHLLNCDISHLLLPLVILEEIVSSLLLELR